VDREEGASQLLREDYDCDLARIFTLEELVDYKKSQSGTWETALSWLMRESPMRGQARRYFDVSPSTALRTRR
jgi:hypothetical protein